MGFGGRARANGPALPPNPPSNPYKGFLGEGVRADGPYPLPQSP
jgi:hypothetical protein